MSTILKGKAKVNTKEFVPMTEEEATIVDPEQHKKILERYLPVNRKVREIDLFALCRLPISLKQKISIAQEIWKEE